MTKAEIVAEIASKTNIEKVAVQQTVESFMDAIKKAMAMINRPAKAGLFFLSRFHICLLYEKFRSIYC